MWWNRRSPRRRHGTHIFCVCLRIIVFNIFFLSKSNKSVRHKNLASTFRNTLLLEKTPLFPLCNGPFTPGDNCLSGNFMFYYKWIGAHCPIVEQWTAARIMVHNLRLFMWPFTFIIVAAHPVLIVCAANKGFFFLSCIRTWSHNAQAAAAANSRTRLLVTSQFLWH